MVKCFKDVDLKTQLQIKKYIYIIERHHNIQLGNKPDQAVRF